MKITLVILIIILILALLIVPFARQMVLDKEELSRTPINEKFKILVDIINEQLFNGRGEITLLEDDPKQMNLFCEDQANYLIQFYYSTGNLTIILKYKYFHHELKHEELYSGLRQASAFQQKDIAFAFLEVCHKQIRDHQNKVSKLDVSQRRGASYLSSEADPTAILSSGYKDLSLEQKTSIINLMYYIAEGCGKSQETISNMTVINQELLMLNLDLQSCIQQYQVYGTSKIISDLQGLDENVIVFIVLSCRQLLNEIGHPSTDKRIEISISRFLEIFEKLGYPEEKLSNLIQKIDLLSSAFGL